jgi:hypothetical protein
MDRDLVDRLASVAHDLWRRQAEEDGWRHGPYSEQARTHDALVPYDQLSEFDRHRLRISIECLELEDELRRSVDHDRGPSREFCQDELRVGLLVQLTGPFGEGPVEAEGTVENWEPGPDGSLEVIRVRFTDDDCIEYYPSQCELRRVE